MENLSYQEFAHEASVCLTGNCYTSCLGSIFFFFLFFVLWLGNFMYKGSVNFHKKNFKLDTIYPIYKWKKLKHIEFLSNLTDKAWNSDELVKALCINWPKDCFELNSRWTKIYPVIKKKKKVKKQLMCLRSWHPVYHFTTNRWGNNGNSFYFFGLQNHCRWWLKI